MSDVTKALESQVEQPASTSDEDDAILAFSDSLPGNEGAPKAVETDPNVIIAEKKAEAELEQLSSNDATAAFAGLI